MSETTTRKAASKWPLSFVLFLKKVHFTTMRHLRSTVRERLDPDVGKIDRAAAGGHKNDKGDLGGHSFGLAKVSPILVVDSPGGEHLVLRKTRAY